MVRLEDIEPKPLGLKGFVWGNVAAACIFVPVFWLLILARSPAAIVFALGWPLLVLGTVFTLFVIPGWKGRAWGFLLWLFIWGVASAFFMGIAASMS